MLRENFANFVIEAVLNGQLFHHALANALGDRISGLDLDQFAFDKLLDHFRGHVTDVIAIDQHPAEFPSPNRKEPGYWECQRSARRPRVAPLDGNLFLMPRDRTKEFVRNGARSSEQFAGILTTPRVADIV